MWVRETLNKEHFYISADRWYSESAEETILFQAGPLCF